MKAQSQVFLSSLVLGLVMGPQASSFAARNKPGSRRPSATTNGTAPGIDADFDDTPPEVNNFASGDALNAADNDFGAGGAASSNGPPSGNGSAGGGNARGGGSKRFVPGSSNAGNSSAAAMAAAVNSSGSSARAGAPMGDVASTAARAQLGSYVDIDESIRNDLYGTIDFPNAELKDIIKAISRLANKNFILDRKIENRRVTIISPNPVTKQEAYNAFLSALYMNDLTLVPVGKFLKIVESKSAIQSNIRVFYGDYTPASEEIITSLYPLKYLNAEEVQRYITDLVPRSGRVSFIPNTNTLVMTDTGLNLRRVIAILKSIDVPGHEDQLATVRIRYASAKGIAQLIDDILNAQNSRSSRPAVRNQPQKTRGGGIITKIVPDERTNSLVVLANGRGVQELRNLVAKLDNPDAAGGGNIHVYYAKNAVAEELATTVNSLVSGQKTNSTGNQNANNNIPPPPGLPFNNFNQNNNSNNNRSNDDGVKFEGNIKITADKATNSLVIVASGSDYAALRTIFKKLDIPRRQVYVEGTIMEIAVQDQKELSAGINVAGTNFGQVAGFVPSTLTTDQFKTLASTPAGLSGLVTTIASSQKVSVAGIGLIPNVLALIKAIQTNTQSQILHQPQILTSDNQDAEIRVEQKISVPNSTTSYASAAATTTKSYSKESVVISLKITPQLGSDNDLIKLKVEQSIDDFARSRLDQEQIDVTQRKANTLVVVRDGDTVVVGGLQKNTSANVDSKFPLLGDIPILGRLFRGSTSENSRSNLILFLTPHIINEYKDLINITGNKIDLRKDIGDRQRDPRDAFAKEVKEYKATNDADKLKAPPRGWGFRPREDSPGIHRGKEDEDQIRSNGDEDDAPAPVRSARASTKKSNASAYLDTTPDRSLDRSAQQTQPAPDSTDPLDSFDTNDTGAARAATLAPATPAGVDAAANNFVPPTPAARAGLDGAATPPAALLDSSTQTNGAGNASGSTPTSPSDTTLDTEFDEDIDGANGAGANKSKSRSAGATNRAG